MNYQTALDFHAQSIAQDINAALKQNQLSSDTFANYMYAGNATFTVLNTRTGARMTFKVRQSKRNKSAFYVYANLLGDGDKGYVQLGSIYHKHKFYISKECPETMDSVAVRAVLFLIKNAAQISNFPHVEVYHENHCGRCGRKLTTPASIISGMGPECARREVEEGIVPQGQRRTVGQRPNRVTN